MLDLRPLVTFSHSIIGYCTSLRGLCQYISNLLDAQTFLPSVRQNSLHHYSKLECFCTGSIYLLEGSPKQDPETRSARMADEWAISLQMMEWSCLERNIANTQHACTSEMSRKLENLGVFNRTKEEQFYTVTVLADSHVFESGIYSGKEIVIVSYRQAIKEYILLYLLTITFWPLPLKNCLHIITVWMTEFRNGVVLWWKILKFFQVVHRRGKEANSL